MRLFTAVPIPEPARAELAMWVPNADAAVPDGVRWTAPEQWHLTLVFLGEVPDEHVPDVLAIGAAALSDVPPLTLQLRGAGRFEDRALWVGLADADALRAATDTLRDGLRDAGVAFDDKPFRAHLTLARPRGGRSLDLRPAVAALSGFVGQPWSAAGVDLVRSRLGKGPGGAAVHETLTTWPLH